MKKILFLCIGLLVSSISFAQTIVKIGSQPSVTSCELIVYDNNGLDSNYSSNRSDKITIYSNNPSNAAVQIEVVLSDFNIHPSDTLYIYDGTSDVDSLLLDKINDSTVWNISATSIIYTATVKNHSGALTLKFVTNEADEGTGFYIKSYCVAPCQRVKVHLDSTLSSHHPVMDDDGFYYIDLCPYDTLHLVAYGEYPDNNYSYFQSDAESKFHWDLGLKVIDSIGYNTLDHHFITGRGYDVSVNITDSAGCSSTMPQIFRIRTSENPIRGVAKFQPMCTGNEIYLDTGYDNISSIQVDSIGSKQITTLRVTDTIFLPDGIDCGDGCAYQSPVTFTAFSPTAVITDPNDILYVRIKIEHSFIGDIYIGLTCPDGQFVKIMNKYGSSGSANCAGSIPTPWGWNLTSGVSSGADFGVVQGNGSNKCDLATNPMGTGWNYCWSNTT
ncbi:MAG: hypothetical protein RR356_04145, partial [Bacteroidales bacterium]